MPVTVQKVKTIILTSFRDAPNHKCTKYSIARWQPRNCSYPELKSLAPLYPDGKAIRNLSPDEYRIAYEKYVLSSSNAKRQLQAVIDLINNGESICLMCWCNLSRQSEYDKLFCHRILVGWFIEKTFPQVEVIYADGAQTPVWEK